MHKLQRKLQTDHLHLLRLLKCLSHEIDCYDFDSQRNADLAVILSALDYMTVYSDKWHHPAEDIIFDRLIKKAVKESDLIKELKNEHQTITQETHKIHELFKNVAEDCVVSANELLTAARHFIGLQKQHIEKESEHIYPLMDSALSDQDWDAIEKEITLQNDPLFDETSKKEYDHLYRFIVDLEKSKQE
jgi:hemerythrin-like domain-containing protein